MDIRIALCDDEPKICALLEEILTDILEDKDIHFEIEPFYSGESFCAELRRQIYDLVFLDIELGNRNGIDVGRYIRDELKNEVIQIVYISAKMGYAMELFEFRPINFLVKPLEYSRVKRVIDKFITITAQNTGYFEYKKKMDYYKVPISNILYFESKNRKVRIKTFDEEDEFYGSMENVYEKVKSDQFLYIHKSIIVNYRQIKKISYEEVVMSDGVILPISQNRRAAIRQQCVKLRKGEQ